jgi:hypothetical protein
MPLDPQFVIGAGATGVLLLVFAGAIRGDLRFRPGIEAENKAKDAHEKAHSGRLVDAVDKLADALEARNRRDERTRRVGQ